MKKERIKELQRRSKHKSKLSDEQVWKTFGISEKDEKSGIQDYPKKT